MWWGIALGIVMLSLLSGVPREFVTSILGTGKGMQGILRATIAGVFLDLCSHGILMVGVKLYERGASTAQVMAFLIASPWNSFSLTLILAALIGIPLTIVFVVLSMLIALLSGYLFQLSVSRNILTENPLSDVKENEIRFLDEAKERLGKVQWSAGLVSGLFLQGIKESRMVLRWLFFGVLLASIIRALIDATTFAEYFGPSILGLGLTIIAATVIEVCSEGSTPIAADLVTRAHAPGNGFAFLMAGVSTDYTEVMVLREATNSWKTTLFLPLITIPQVLVMSWILNQW